jgi:hypothetical protein
MVARCRGPERAALTFSLRRADAAGIVLAQSLGEYGAVSGGALANALTVVSDAFDTVTYTVRHAEPMTWFAVGAVALVLWIVFRR